MKCDPAATKTSFWHGGRRADQRARRTLNLWYSLCPDDRQATGNLRMHASCATVSMNGASRDAYIHHSPNVSTRRTLAQPNARRVS